MGGSTSLEQEGARAAGGQFHYNKRVIEIMKDIDASARSTLHRTTGVRCRDTQSGEEVIYRAPIVVNCGGPHSAQITRMAFDGIDNDMKISTRACRQEVAHVPAPDNIDFEKEVRQRFQCWLDPSLLA